VILSIAITSDDKYLITGDSEEPSNVKQFSVSGGKMIKDYGGIIPYRVVSITTTADNKWLFIGSIEGHLQQTSLESQQLVKDYGKIHYLGISCLETTRDSKWLITGSWDNHVKRISVENREVDKDFGHVCDYNINRMKISADE
jgi:WD40 repeat protein